MPYLRTVDGNEDTAMKYWDRAAICATHKCLESNDFYGAYNNAMVVNVCDLRPYAAKEWIRICAWIARRIAAR